MESNTSFSIFLVDDDPICMAMYEQHLLNLGFSNISRFTDGRSFLRELSSNPDIVFLDYKMKGMNGIEVLKAIKSFNKDTYVIMISGQEDVQTAIDAINYGAFDYIVKGNNMHSRLQHVLNRILESEEAKLLYNKNVVF